jgi:hypothetical protein
VAEKEKGKVEQRDGSELFGERQGVFMIASEAERAGMHPETLRVYESRGVMKPTR